MPYFALGVLLLLAILAMGQVYVKASPRMLAQLVKAVGLALAGMVFLLAIVSAAWRRLDRAGPHRFVRRNGIQANFAAQGGIGRSELRR